MVVRGETATQIQTLTSWQKTWAREGQHKPQVIASRPNILSAWLNVSSYTSALPSAARPAVPTELVIRLNSELDTGQPCWIRTWTQPTGSLSAIHLILCIFSICAWKTQSDSCQVRDHCSRWRLKIGKHETTGYILNKGPPFALQFQHASAWNRWIWWFSLSRSRSLSCLKGSQFKMVFQHFGAWNHQILLMK